MNTKDLNGNIIATSKSEIIKYNHFTRRINEKYYFICCDMVIRLSKSNRKNAKTKDLLISYIDNRFEGKTKLKKYITQDDLLNVLDFINVNKKEYKNISIYMNDARFPRVTRDNKNKYFSIECFIADFLNVATLVNGGYNETSPYFLKNDNSGAIDSNISYHINKYYHG